MLAGDLYIADDPELHEQMERADRLSRQYEDLVTAWHPTEPAPRRAKLEAAAPIAIGDNVWLGGGAIVLPGVTIGAGAVVTKDLPAGALAVGNPARVIRSPT
jgi:maltose O-acetyltransferase